MGSTVVASLVLDPRSYGDTGFRCTKYRVRICSSTPTGTGGERLFHDNIGVGSQKLHSCGPHWWRLGRFSVAEAVGVHRSSEAFVGSSWWKLLGFSCSSFLPQSEVRSKRSCWAEGWSDSGKILPSFSYVAILCFAVPLGCCSFLIVSQSFPRAILVCG